MAGYSRENERQNNALRTILRGGEPEKRIFVSAGVDKEFKEKIKEERELEQKRVDERLEVTKEARVPWFCPDCNKVMKSALDEKMWYLYNQCFDCQVKVENKMRINGTYDEWAQKKVIANKLAWLRDQKQQIKEFMEQKTPVYYNQVRPDGHSVDEEKWTDNFEELQRQAGEALEHLEKIEESLK
tara:strand:- start:654 stop:1208 length:555 start_codon:yes stop_codon:yes gene_type:complete